VAAYASGRTPIPCAACNTKVKFRSLDDRASRFGCDAVATGHYARLGRDAGGRPQLMKARDEQKDQSYFLYDLDREQLNRALFPLGDLTKGEVREQARRAGLPNAEKEESMDICFVAPGETPATFVEKSLARSGEPLPAHGAFLDSAGSELGRHAGIHRFTVGQRRGLKAAFGQRRYVTSIDAATGDVVLGSAEDLLETSAKAAQVRWTSIEIPGGPIRATVRVRHRGREHPAEIIPEGADRVRIEFAEPVRAVAPGQAAVFSDGEVILGGGILQGP